MLLPLIYTPFAIIFSRLSKHHNVEISKIMLSIKQKAGVCVSIHMNMNTVMSRYLEMINQLTQLYSNVLPPLAIPFS